MVRVHSLSGDSRRIHEIQQGREILSHKRHALTSTTTAVLLEPSGRTTREVFPVHHGRTRVLERVSRVLRDTISMGLGPPCTDCRDCGRLSRACLYRTRAHLPFRTTRGMPGARYHCHLLAKYETSKTTFLYGWHCRCLIYRDQISLYKIENFSNKPRRMLYRGGEGKKKGRRRRRGGRKRRRRIHFIMSILYL